LTDNGWTSFPRLYPILDAELVLRDVAGDRERREACLRRMVRELAEANVKVLQYRNKCDNDEIVLQDALVIREAAQGALKLILNDRVPLIKPAGWDGVHVGQQDLSAREARLLAGENAILGLSTHAETETSAANLEPVDYVAVGPVFPTASKADPDPVIGLDGVRRARALTGKPLIAIGGINAANAHSVIDAGADSVAVIAAIFASGRSPGHSARDFLSIFK
jgi:thiamine-phosphate pyrophosphorylase